MEENKEAPSMLPEEIWKDIPGYKYHYRINNFGEIRSYMYSIEPKLIKPEYIKGYQRVCLSDGIKSKHHFVHRLVLLAFEGDSKLQVNHINGIKDDNKLENLEYVTPSENVKHRFDILGHTAWNKGLYNIQYPNSKKIIQYNLYGDKIEEFNSINEASRKLNIHAQNIGQCINSKRKSAGGYIWRSLVDN